MQLTEHFQVALIFLVAGIAMVVVPLGALIFLRPRKPSAVKLMPYECGKDPVGPAQVRFDMRFYTDALIFLVFEVETVFLFPWARVFTKPEVADVALAEGLIFVGILFLALVYVWAKGDIDWVKSTESSRDEVRKQWVVPQDPIDEPAPRQPEPVGSSPGADA